MKVPTSVTGTSTVKFKNRQCGFTLFEILVVVFIVIITVSAVVFTTTIARGESDLRQLGQDLGKLVHLLYQEAIFENRNFAIALHDKGYSVLEYDGEVWATSQQRFFRKVKMHDGQSSQLVVDQQPLAPVSVEQPQPQILILSSGEMSTFEWTINDKHLKSQIILQGNLLGNVTVLGPIKDEDDI